MKVPVLNASEPCDFHGRYPLFVISKAVADKVFCPGGLQDPKAKRAKPAFWAGGRTACPARLEPKLGVTRYLHN